MKSFEYRLYPTRNQREALTVCLTASCQVYNEMLEYSIRRYEDEGKATSCYDLHKAFKGKRDHVPASTVQALGTRLYNAFVAFFRRVKNGEKPGFPRFKSPNRWRSIPLRQTPIDFYIEGRYLVTPKKTGGRIKIKQHRPLEGRPKTAYLVLRADGHWYVVIVCEMPDVPKDTSRPSIGLDVGLTSFVTDSEGNHTKNPRWYRSAQATLRRQQRHLSRCQKGSHRRRKAKQEVGKTHLKVARQRRDFHFKVAKPYAEGYSHICVESLNIAGMVKNPYLAKSISDAGWGMFLTILRFKAEEAGSEVIEVPARYTSQRCSRCGEHVKKSLSVRTHNCPHCGLVLCRDHNAALNILQAGARPSDAKLDNSPVCPRSSSH